VKKFLFVTFLVSSILALLFFIAYQNYIVKGVVNNIPFIGFIVSASIAVLTGLFALIRFMRKRSLVGGLFMTTTIATLCYFIASKLLAQPAAATIPYNTALANPYTNGVNTLSGSTTTPLFGTITLAQIGLFTLWFLFILFSIYVYVRPIRKIDKLLNQIIEGQEIKKLRVGKNEQYKTIEDKLKTLAEKQYRLELRRIAQREKNKKRSETQRELLKEIIKEKEKLSAE
jgi:hypothetical protein